MIHNSFDKLSEAYYQLEEEEKYEEALLVLQQGLESLPREEIEKNLYTIMFDKCWFAYSSKKYDITIETLKYMIEKKFLCPLYWFEALKDYEEYKELKKNNDLLLIEAQKQAKFQYEVHTPEGYTEEKKYPLFFNLHGDGDNLEYHKKHWKPNYLLDKGYIVVYLQSSQVLRHNSYGWIKNNAILENDSRDDETKIKKTYDKLYEELKTCYDSVSKHYSVDENQVMIGGFSGGAIAAVDITLANIIPIKGVIALCCSLKTNRFTEENINSSLKRGVKWVLMEGEKDLPVEILEDMINTFNKLKVPFEYYINSGVGHWYPQDLNLKLDRALGFIKE